ncbi:PREDICTED: uncharacterized protein LOC106125036 [Papilio xuthus]|uniref:Uncharacterized protein LOC106125036 n=1 Tax=Papilio xuthus TaxID=66420 RepID=A0AAJ6ZR23_PAPXU|nr:PREDICTED: uncharacterized protein LOC106125036 [Papilio xuthus]
MISFSVELKECERSLVSIYNHYPALSVDRAKYLNLVACQQDVRGLTAVLSVTSIRVEVDNEEQKDNTSDHPPTEHLHEPVYFENLEDRTFLIPHEPEKRAQVIIDGAPKLATYLLPPLTGKQSDYQYQQVPPGDQSDWYPMTYLSQNSPNTVPIILTEMNETEALKIIKNTRQQKELQHEQSSVPTPSTELQPPAPDAPNDYIVTSPAEELEYPKNAIQKLNGHRNLEHQRLTFNGGQNRFLPHFQSLYKEKLILPQMLPYSAPLTKHKIPTRFYPKKYSDGFKPIPIPISKYVEDTNEDEIPKAKPQKPFYPMLSTNDEYQTTPDEKKVYLFEEAEKKRNLQKENLNEKESLADNNKEDIKLPTAEQQASASHNTYPERSVYYGSGEQNQRPASQPAPPVPPAPAERTEFRMHGMKGPHSYQFGYDTGKGKNRQFRYEERDNDGHVRGHYGYMDRHGKLRVVNYDADPVHGFRAETPVEKEQ